MGNLCSIVELGGQTECQKNDVRLRDMKKPLERLMHDSLLGWYGHVDRIADDTMVKRIYSCTIEGKMSRGRPKI